MTDPPLERIVDALHAARRAHRAPEVPEPDGLDADAGLRVQLAVLDRLVADGDALGGWKAGLSTGRSRDALGAGFRPFGYVLRSRVLAGGATVPLAGFTDCRVEPELCVLLGRPLGGPDVTPAQAREAADAIAPAFEVNDVRVGMHARPGLFLADGLANWGIVVGEPVPVPADEPATRVTLRRDGREIARSAPDLAMDGPFVALARTCRLLARFGRGLEPGQRVITGAYAQDRVAAPARYRAEFDGIGAVEVAFR